MSDMTNVRYSISQLAEKSGLSVRTLRYYDQIGLLRPLRKKNGYRCYGQKEVRRLQHILLLRSCGFPLSDIAETLASEDADLKAKLEEHLSNLAGQIDKLGRNAEMTKKMIDRLEAYRAMNDDERFEMLKRDSVEHFEEEYGAEARALYGDEAIDGANERMLSMDKPTWEAKEELERRIKETLVTAMATRDSTSPESRSLAEMHAKWIQAHWGDDGYTPDAHRALVQGYLSDPRFVEYYDSACGEGATAFLKDAVLANILNSDKTESEGTE